MLASAEVWHSFCIQWLYLEQRMMKKVSKGGMKNMMGKGKGLLKGLTGGIGGMDLPQGLGKSVFK